MAFDVEAAKADGYTDEEIQQYLATKDQPLPPEPPRDRYDEKIGTLTSVIPDAVKYGLEGAGLYATGKGLIGAIQNRGGPPTAPPTIPAVTPPVTPPMTPAEQTFNTLKTPASVLNAPPPQPPSSGNYMQRMSGLAAKYAPVAGKMAKGAGILGAGLALGQGLFGTSDEDLATLRAADERKRQALLNQIPR